MCSWRTVTQEQRRRETSREDISSENSDGSEAADELRREEQPDSSSESSGNYVDTVVPAEAQALRCAWDAQTACWFLYPSCASVNEAALGDMDPVYR